MDHMLRGDFEAAWKICDRALIDTAHRHPSVARHEQIVWDGTPLEHRRVLVRCYHGLGDTLQFIRYLPLVNNVATALTTWMPAKLIGLLGATAGLGRLLPLHDGVIDATFDVDVELMELPHVFRTTERTIPAIVPYININVD